MILALTFQRTTAYANVTRVTLVLQNTREFFNAYVPHVYTDVYLHLSNCLVDTVSQKQDTIH